jgi:hypothetical protein
MCKTKKKNSAYHPNHVIIYSSLMEKIFHEDSSISMSSYTCTNIYSKKVTLHRTEMAINIIPETTTQIELSKEKK